ncbi:phage holin family protein [Domibacillus indicus]|uniref:phage holin family protein n=1 Tax=Domibacillus indicus TaxID=1437523 RepID=UPI0020415A8B|nr:phage holin family protein [Domibacillus indicus]MCM3789402.1 phage holin family protein [Domibacillus indicus]
MEGFQVFIHGEGLEVVKMYLFGGAQFIDLLLLMMACDIVTGVMYAWKEGRLRSRTALYGYARKVGVFIVIIAANIADQVLGLDGALAKGTVLFYICNEILSIVENAGKLGVPIPASILEKLALFNDKPGEKRVSNKDDKAV